MSTSSKKTLNVNLSKSLIRLIKTIDDDGTLDLAIGKVPLSKMGMKVQTEGNLIDVLG